jgi:outer membrane lipoprotein-sorting protein
MKKLVTLGLVLALLVVTPAVAPLGTANAQSAGLVSSILNRMERNRRDLKSLRAGITMQKYNAQTKEFDMYVGDVQYLPGSGRNIALRVDWQRPARETLAVENGQYILFRPRMNLAYKGSTSSGSKSSKVNNVLGFGLNASGAQLRNNFNVEFVGEGILYGNLHVTQLRLTPKGGAGYQFAEVWVDNSGMPVQTRIVEKNNDATTVRLTDVQKNARIDSAVFKLELGSNVKVVKG